MIMSRVDCEKGAALPITIFIVTVLTIMLVASFTRVRNEFQLAGGTNDMVTAFGVAQSGLETYTGMYHASRPPDGDSLRINVAGGYADVTASLMRNDSATGNWMYVIRSAGSVVDPLIGPQAQAQHTVAQFAHWDWGNPATPAAWSSLAHILISSSLPPGADPDTYISGVDACGMAPTITGAQAMSIPDTTGITALGSPPLIEQGGPSTVSDLTGIDWQSALGAGITPDSDTLIPDDNTYKTYRVTGDLTTPTIRGTGLLIVTGTLVTLGNHFTWDGVVLVGSRLLANASDSTVIRGMLVTGLNWQIGGPFDNITLEDEPLAVRYDSCKIKNAVQSLRGFVAIPNGWLDNWTAY